MQEEEDVEEAVEGAAVAAAVIEAAQVKEEAVSKGLQNLESPRQRQ